MLAPAPPRGCYDRSLSNLTRHAQQHERLLEATTAALAEHGREPNVTTIVAAARVARNTFYEHFDNLADAVAEADDRAAALLRQQLKRSGTEDWTPRERLRSLLGAWLAFVAAEPTLARALLRKTTQASRFALTRAGEVLREILEAVLREALRDAVISTPPDGVRVVAMTAAVEAIARVRLEQPWNRTDHTALAVDLVVRAFR